MVRQGLSVGLAVGAYGVSFGAAGTAAGLSVLQTCLLSLVAFTGASQFALVGVLAGGGAPLAGVAGALLLGTRNTLYAVRLAPVLGRRHRAVSSLLVLDESTAVAVAQPTAALQRLGFWVTGLAVYAGWNLMTLAGALGAQALGDPRALGLDAAVAAAFLGLLWGHLGSPRARAVAASAVGVAVVAVPFVPVGVPVLLAALTVLPWVLGRPTAPDSGQRALQTPDGAAPTPEAPDVRRGDADRAQASGCPGSRAGGGAGGRP